jgi:hypothetical protein
LDGRCCTQTCPCRIAHFHAFIHEGDDITLCGIDDRRIQIHTGSGDRN